MAPIIPIFLLLLIPILLIIGGLIYLGIKGIEAGGIKKFLGILSLVIGSILVIIIGFGIQDLFNHEDNVRNEFIGNYKSVEDNSDWKGIELNIDKTNYLISRNTITNCTTGTWDIELLDEGYVIKFNCAEGQPLSQYYLNDNKLINLKGEVKFIRINPKEEKKIF